MFTAPCIINIYVNESELTCDKYIKDSDHLGKYPLQNLRELLLSYILGMNKRVIRELQSFKYFCTYL